MQVVSKTAYLGLLFFNFINVVGNISCSLEEASYFQYKLQKFCRKQTKETWGSKVV